MSLIIKNLSIYLAGRQILKNINLTVKAKTIHVLMGPNGSGKSTLAQAVMANKNYELRSNNYELSMNGKNIKQLKTDERARLGLFLAFQNPIAITGVSLANLLRTSNQFIHPSKSEKNNKKRFNGVLSVLKFNNSLVNKARELNIPKEFLGKSLNEEFSGGEKKKLEMLQAMVLQPQYAIFDEIDTGLDVDALKIIAGGINQLKKSGTGILLITHYQRILKYLKVDQVSILVGGKIVKSGGYQLAVEVERNGYKKWIK